MSDTIHKSWMKKRKYTSTPRKKISDKLEETAKTYLNGCQLPENTSLNLIITIKTTQIVSKINTLTDPCILIHKDHSWKLNKNTSINQHLKVII